jgi:hypothetical protein
MSQAKRIGLKSRRPGLGLAVALCAVSVFSSANRGPITARPFAANLSTCTTCAEEDNINVPLYAAGARAFQIIATHPAYPLTTAFCQADFSGCSPAAPASGREPLGADGSDCLTLYDDGLTVVQACTDASWWRAEPMRIEVGESSAPATRLEIYRKVEGQSSWPSFLVLYEDGNLRLIPHPAAGEQSVCYGSSVIVGPAAPSARPLAEIVSAVVDPLHSTIDLVYRDGGTAHLRYSVNRQLAAVQVNIGYAADDGRPFATFRSMWVRDGNCDVDRITTQDGDFDFLACPSEARSWTQLAGQCWTFRRRFWSQHNTTAPDISILVLPARGGF